MDPIDGRRTWFLHVIAVLASKKCLVFWSIMNDSFEVEIPKSNVITEIEELVFIY